ncbi:MAG TPA: DUF4148 domain-containing protein [Paraburkholderia sp.]|jgi:hypothetical protein|nr:DUF4148 domain-containing protein [Paraburkholderia sp.]
MKTIASLVIAAAALAAPVLSFAQSADQGLTRAQVRAELVQLERAGYNPSDSSDTRYPVDVQAAEAKVAAATDAQTSRDAVGGMPTNGTSAAGKPGTHMKAASSCVGPVSFCNLYFGS